MPTKSWLRQTSDEDLLAEIDNDLNEALSFFTVAKNSGEYLMCFGPLEEAVTELQEGFRRLGRLQKRAATAKRLLWSLERGIGPKTVFGAGMRKKITILRDMLEGVEEPKKGKT